VEIVMEDSNDGSVSVNGAAKKARRGSWTKDQKRQIVGESQVAGASLAEVAQRHGVRVALVSSWRRQWARSAKGAPKSGKFAAVRMNAPPVDGIIEIDLAGGCVRVRGIVDAQMLREVLAAAR
jgi:transposase-like protein